MKTELDELIEDIRTKQKAMTNDERVALWQGLMADYCPFCGCNDPNCPCERDE